MADRVINGNGPPCHIKGETATKELVILNKRTSKKLSKRKTERRMATTPTFEKAWEVVATKCEQIHHEDGIIPYLWISEVFNKVELMNMHDDRTYAVYKIKVRGKSNE